MYEKNIKHHTPFTIPENPIFAFLDNGSWLKEQHSLGIVHGLSCMGSGKSSILIRVQIPRGELLG
jgi:hypothetical protein